jgi:hypothetical protein
MNNLFDGSLDIGGMRYSKEALQNLIVLGAKIGINHHFSTGRIISPSSSTGFRVPAGKVLTVGTVKVGLFQKTSYYPEVYLYSSNSDCGQTTFLAQVDNFSAKTPLVFEPKVHPSSDGNPEPLVSHLFGYKIQAEKYLVLYASMECVIWVYAFLEPET